MIDWLIHGGLLQPFEVVELKTLRHDRLQSSAHLGIWLVLLKHTPVSTHSCVAVCQVEEADHIYLLMKEEYRISRNVRLAWFLGKLNQVIWPASKPELVSFKHDPVDQSLFARGHNHSQRSLRTRRTKRVRKALSDTGMLKVSLLLNNYWLTFEPNKIK